MKRICSSLGSAGIAGLLLILLLVLSAAFAPFIARYDPYKINPPQRLHPPSLEHLFGTDFAGRDIFARVVYGARISLLIGVTVITIASFVGGLWGAIAALSGGYVDEILMRLADVFLTFPPLILAIAVNAALGRGLLNAMLALTVTWWPTYARLMRGQVLVVKEQEYIQAARAIGVSKLRLLIWYILPNAWAPVIVRATIDFGNAVMECASLSFIGLGAQPPLAEWGAMITQGRMYLNNAWWASTFPGLAILLTVLGFNLFGDALQDFLNPRLRSQRGKQ